MICKRVLPLLLAVLILMSCFAGCGAGTEETVAVAATGGAGAKGRYVEASIPLPSGSVGWDMAALSNGRLAVAMYEDSVGFRVYTTGTDPIAWEEAYALPEGLLSEEDYLEAVALAPDGGAFCSMMKSLGDGEYEPHFYLLDAAGTSRELPILYENVDLELGYFASAADFASDGRLLAQFYLDEVREVDLQTGALGENLNQELPTVRTFRCGGEAVYMMGNNGVSVWRDGEVQTLSGAMADQLVASLQATEGVSPKLTFWENDEGYLFFTTHDGLYSCVPGGSVTEELVSGARSSLGDPNFFPMALTGMEDGSFWVLGNSTLYRYTYDPEAPTQADTQLRIYSLYDDDDLRQMIAQYQAAHPEVSIDLEIGLTGEDGITEADAIRTLNTQILAGDGPDLLRLDGFSLDAYLEKEVLLDLTSVLQEAGPLLEQVTNCYARDGRVYAVPTTFALPALYGAEHIVSQIHDLDSLVAAAQQAREENPDMDRIVNGVNPVLMAITYYDSCSAAWRNADGTLDEAALVQYYQAMRDLYALDESFRQSFPEYVEAMSADVDTLLQMMGEYTGIGGASYLFQEIYYLPAGTLDGMEQWSYALAGESEYLGDGYKTIHLNAQASNVFLPRRIMGILATSAHPDEAKAFLAFMLSDTVQSQDLTTGFPVNQTTFERQIEEEGTSDITFSSSDDQGNYFEYKGQWPDAACRQELKGWVDNLTTPALTDGTIRRMVLAQMDDCCNGVITPQQAAQAAIQSLNLYLSE